MDIMDIYNISDIVKLKVDRRLPFYSRQILSKAGIPAKETEPLPYSLTIRQGFSDFPLPGGWLSFDLCRMAENAVEWRARHKFSRWKYRLYRLDAASWQLEIKGDFFSQWIWPHQLAGAILRLLLWRGGLMQIPTAGVFSGIRAVLLLSSPETEKFLDKFLESCSDKVHYDKMTTWKDGSLIPSRRSTRSRSLNSGLSFPAAGNLPKGQPSSVPIGGMIVLRRGSSFSKIYDAEKTAFANRITGDLEIYDLPLLRIAEMETLTGFSVLGAEDYLSSCRASVGKLLENVPITVLELPPDFSMEQIETLKKEILS